MKLVGALAGMTAGALAGWALPALLIPRPHEFDFLAILGWRAVLVPAGALLGLVVGLVCGGLAGGGGQGDPPGGGSRPAV
jgi:hypothetical protein